MTKPEDLLDRLLRQGVKCLLTDKDVALLLGIKPGGMRQRRYKAPDTLPPSFQLGKCHRYDPEEVAAWLTQQKQRSRR